MSLGEFFNVVDNAGNSPLFYAISPETVRMVLEMDTNGEIVVDPRMLQNLVRQGKADMCTVLFSRVRHDVAAEDGTTAFTSALGTFNTGKN